jgi:hypothetical protein
MLRRDQPGSNGVLHMFLGRPPRNIRAFARDYATYFTAAAPSKEAGQSELPR